MKYLTQISLALFSFALLASCGGGSSSRSGDQSGVGSGGTGSGGSGSESVTLTWTPPTQNTDGSALDNLAGYKIFYGNASNRLTSIINVDNPGLSSYTISGLDDNSTYYFSMTAYTDENVESAFSNITIKVF